MAVEGVGDEGDSLEVDSVEAGNDELQQLLRKVLELEYAVSVCIGGNGASRARERDARGCLSHMADLPRPGRLQSWRPFCGRCICLLCCGRGRLRARKLNRAEAQW